MFNLIRNTIDPWDAGRSLIRWNNREKWTIGNSFEGVAVFGDTGSGKSSTSAKLLATSFLRAGYGGLVLTVKPEDTHDWLKLIEANGRQNDAVVFGPDHQHTFNFLDYEISHGKALNLGSRNATHILSELVAITQRQSGRNGDFWTQAANEMIAATLELFMAAGVSVSLKAAKEVIESAPLSLEQARDYQWQAKSLCYQLLIRGKRNAGNVHDFPLAERYWMQHFPQLPDKTRSSIVATFTASVAQHFCPHTIHQLFGAASTVTPDAISEGKIIIVDLPVRIYGQAGRFANVVWKYSTQLAIERRKNKYRPVFIFADEAHNFITDYDQQFQTTARSSRCSTVYLTQNLANYRAESPGDTGKQRIESLCNCLKTRILHQCSDPTTRKWFADAMGKRRVSILRSESRNFGKGATTYNESYQMSEEYWLQPDYACHLETGTECNNFKVRAVVTQAGKSTQIAGHT